MIESSAYKQLAYDHLNDTELYLKDNKTTLEAITTKINKVWKTICTCRNIPKSIQFNYRKPNAEFPKFYFLIKTHKSLSDLKIRPIVSSINGPGKKYMWLITRLLNPLLQDVPSHLRNSMELIDKINDFDKEDLKRFNFPCSFDVTAMYTSIPTQEAISNAVQMLTEKNFAYHGLTASDVGDMLTVLLDNTYFKYENIIYKQTQGLPMGASISGILAILFMHSLEKQILPHPSIGIYARYVDDIFVLATNKTEATRLLEVMNDLHPNLKFTIEFPTDDNSLSLLDFSVKISKQSVNFNFYKKSAKKPLFVNYSSALPLRNKVNYVKNEYHRRMERCSTTAQRQEASREFQEILKLNDYPKDFMNIKLPRIRLKPTSGTTEYSYYKIPFVSDSLDDRISRVFNDLDLPVRITHPSFTLRMALNTATKNVHPCTWKSCQNPSKDICQEKSVVYKITCNRCQEYYIGSTF